MLEAIVVVVVTAMMLTGVMVRGTMALVSVIGTAAMLLPVAWLVGMVLMLLNAAPVPITLTWIAAPWLLPIGIHIIASMAKPIDLLMCVVPLAAQAWAIVTIAQAL